MIQIIFQKFIYREDLIKNRRVRYLFGDNDEREGLGGQAKEMRGEPNAIGIRVKKSPGTYNIAYYKDSEYNENRKKIFEDFNKVENYLIQGGIVIIPSDGIGTGLAKLKEFAPKTLNCINSCIEYLRVRYNT